MKRTKKSKISGSDDEGTAALLKLQDVHNPAFGIQND